MSDLQADLATCLAFQVDATPGVVRWDADNDQIVAGSTVIIETDSGYYAPHGADRLLIPAALNLLRQHGPALAHQSARIAELEAEVGRLRALCSTESAAAGHWMREACDAHNALVTIRDSTFRNAVTLRGMADHALSAHAGATRPEPELGATPAPRSGG